MKETFVRVSRQSNVHPLRQLIVSEQLFFAEFQYACLTTMVTMVYEYTISNKEHNGHIITHMYMVNVFLVNLSVYTSCQLIVMT